MRKMINLTFMVLFVLASVAPGSIFLTVILGTFINLGFYWGGWVWIFGAPICVVALAFTVALFDVIHRLLLKKFPKVIERIMD